MTISTTSRPSATTCCIRTGRFRSRHEGRSARDAGPDARVHRRLSAPGLDRRLTNVDRVVATGAMDRDEVLQGEFWRLISGGFMHANAEHLIGNMVMLFILGMACEHAFGRGPFLFLYVAACVAGSLVAMISGTPTVGASGAIFGLAGALIAMIRAPSAARSSSATIVSASSWRYGRSIRWASGLFNPIVSNSCPPRRPARRLDPRFLSAPALLTDRRRTGRSADHPTARPASRSQLLIGIGHILPAALASERSALTYFVLGRV